MEYVVAEYLKKLNIPVSEKYCRKLIASHSDYPSLLSIADTLQRLGIHHRVARMEVTELYQLPPPYLLHSAGQARMLLVQHQKDLVAVHNREAAGQVVVLQAAPTRVIADPENRRRRLEETLYRTIMTLFCLALTGLSFVLLPSVQNLFWIHFSLLILAVAGSVTGWLLINKELRIQYKPVEALCGTGSKANCDAVLRSPGGWLLGNITLSDATTSYFLFQILMLGLLIPLSGGATPYYGILGFLSILTVPVVLYSLYYQAVHIKVWCRLCLIVDAILLGQTGLFGYLYTNNIILVGDARGLPAILTLLLLVTTLSGMILVKNAFIRAIKAEKAEIVANRIKYDPDTFLHLLRRQKLVDFGLFEQEMLIGNPEAPLTITMAVSLRCGPCKEGFEQVKRLVASYPDTVKLAVRLQFRRGDKGSQEPGIWLLGWWQRHIQGKPNASVRTEQLLQDWYESMELLEFGERYPLETNGSDNGMFEKLKVLHEEWMDQAEIKTTPTFFINGHRLSKQYRIEDLVIFLPEMIDYLERQDIKKITLITTDKELTSVREHSERSNSGLT